MAQLEDDKLALKDKVDGLTQEVQAMNLKMEDHLQDELLRDLEEWVSECLLYNQSFVENQELIEKLLVTCENQQNELDESDHSRRSRNNDLNVDEIKRIINKIQMKNG